SFYDYERQFVDIGRFLKEILALFPPTSVKKFHNFLRVTSMNNQRGKVVKPVNIEFKKAA
ncbi:MAG: hypothetical protein ORN54_05355, partial [Cyclobacteriaceae bacterium]|nr:hypothetical protein [Cyclobacteriaceae bacterium]